MGRPYRWVVEPERSDICALYISGLSMNQVAERIGRSRGTVKKVLEDEGVARRANYQTGPANRLHVGRKLTAKGYVMVWIPEDDPMRAMVPEARRGYIDEHRLVMARHLGRPLVSCEHVHHRDGDKANNCIENLELWITNHPAGVRLRCADCGSEHLEAR